MEYRHGDRKQMTLFPQSIDEYIPKEAPVKGVILKVEFEQMIFVFL